MKLVLLALVLSVGVACELVCAGSQSNSRAWRQFKRQHGKVYATQAEDARRFAIFMANKKLIESHNANASRTFDMGLNHMADWTDEEYARLNGASIPDDQLDVISDEELAAIIRRGAPLPDHFDWRNQLDRVSAIKDQKQCGSCWAFATIGLLEGQELPENMGSLVPLSEQQLVDCSKSNKGCEGGWMSKAIDDLVNATHIDADFDYPYTGKESGACNVVESHFVSMKVKGHKMLPKGDAKTLKQVIVNYGPVAVAIQATNKFKLYGGGVFQDDQCQPGNPNHAVLIIGYGTDPKKGDYWIGKNSWGLHWGIIGFFKIKAGINMCGIEDFGTIFTY